MSKADARANLLGFGRVLGHIWKTQEGLDMFLLHAQDSLHNDMVVTCVLLEATGTLDGERPQILSKP